jgi:hypothetical protein
VPKHPPWHPPQQGDQVTDNRPSDRPTCAALPAALPDNGMVPRFHPPHSVFGDGATGAVESSREVMRAIAGRSDRHVGEHLQQQAAELTQHLHARERELSHWEATLNARCAAHDDELRSARLWWREQQQELAGREAELERRNLVLEQQTAQLEANGVTAESLARRGDLLDQRQQQIEQREQSLQQRSQQVREQAAELEQQQISWEGQRRAQEHSLEQQRRQWQADCAATQTLNEQLRRRIEEQREAANERQDCGTLRAELERLRAALRERETGLIRDCRAWELEKERWQQRTLHQRRTIAQHWRFRGRILQTQQRALRQRREQLDQRQQAIEQLQAELHGAQRELLERRLAIELSRNGLSARVLPNELSAIRLCVRKFLTDQTAALEAARQRQRQELQTLAASLTQQQEALAIRHEALQRWALERQQESDDQAAQLELREQELEQLHQQLLRDKQAWLIALDEGFANAIKKASRL